MGKFDHVLIVSDLDYTFLGEKGALVPRNLEALERFRAEGGKFTVATGRRLFDVKRAIPNLEQIINAPAILANGSILHDVIRNEEIDSGVMDFESAYEIVNSYSEEALKRIIYDYGEERFAPRIASAICKSRSEHPITTTHELTEIIKGAIPSAARADGPHPAKRTFQAIRIEVNGELDAITPLIDSAAKNLVPGGRIAVISFHSLEDRLVKQGFKSLLGGCTCPKDFPVCICGRKPVIKEISRKPILPTEEELENNPRSRSAKLRVAEKL